VDCAERVIDFDHGATRAEPRRYRAVFGRKDDGDPWKSALGFATMPVGDPGTAVPHANDGIVTTRGRIAPLLWYTAAKPLPLSAIHRGTRLIGHKAPAIYQVLVYARSHVEVLIESYYRVLRIGRDCDAEKMARAGQ
jgi:hypothetical protein